MKKVSMNGKKNNYQKNTVVSELSPKPKKQFQLYYRQRDQSAPQNQFQSIIFVKSHRCKPETNSNNSKFPNKKNKVNEQFKKIMKDLDTHMKQNNNKTQKQFQSVFNSKEVFSGKPSLKTTGLSKNKTKPNDQNAKPKKLTQRSAGKPYKKINNFFDQQPQAFTSKKTICKKKTNTSKQILKSPDGKIKLINSKYQSKISQNKKIRLSQRADFQLSSRMVVKSPIKTRIQFQSKNNKALNNSPKSKEIQSSCYNNKTKKKDDINQVLKYTIRKPIQGQSILKLNQEQYIFLDGQIVLTNNHSLFQLQNRLLSTYRIYDDSEKSPNKNLGSYQACSYQKYAGILDSNNNAHRADQQQNSERTSQFYSRRDSQAQLKVVKLFLVKKVVTIQRWWRNALQKAKQENSNIKFCLYKGLSLGKAKITKVNSEQSKLIQNNDKSDLEYAHFPSQQSIVFGKPKRHQNEPKNQFMSQKSVQFTITQRNNINSSQMSLISQRQNAAKDQKTTHQQIIQNLLCQNKISLDCYNQKLNEIEQEYQNQLEQVQKMRQFLARNAQRVLNLKNKIIQDKKLAQNISSQQDQELLSKIFGKKQLSIFNNFTQEGLFRNQLSCEVQIKEYHIGQVQQQSSIKNQKVYNYAKQMGANQKYQKKRNQNGDEYYQDFQQEQSQEQMKIDQNQFSVQSILECFHPNFVANANFTQLLEEFKQQQMVKTAIDTRIAYQMGAIQQPSILQNSQQVIGQAIEKIVKVDTSIIGIHKFLNSFFNFYMYCYKDDFLRLVNMPYGYPPEKRISFIQGYEDTSDEVQEDQNGVLHGLQFVMPDQALQDYYQQFYSQFVQKCDKNSYQRQIIECEKIHNRAVFDSFNEALNNFRPYYQLNGPPYPWNTSQKVITFYFTSQQNIPYVFQKTQYKVLRCASSLLGISIQKYKTQQKLQTNQLQAVQNHYKISSHPMVLQSREQRLAKQQKIQILESIAKWNSFQQQSCALLIQISSLIFQQLIEQQANQMPKSAQLFFQQQDQNYDFLSGFLTQS